MKWLDALWYLLMKIYICCNALKGEPFFSHVHQMAEYQDFIEKGIQIPLTATPRMEEYFDSFASLQTARVENSSKCL